MHKRNPRHLTHNRTVAVVGIACTFALTSACSAETGSPAELGTPSSAAATASPSPASAPKSTNFDPDMATGGMRTNSKGSYLQITPTDEQFDISLDSMEPSLAERMTEDEIEAVHEIALTFVVEEVIDSEVNGDHSMADEWWSEHASIFTSDYRQAFQDSLDDPGSEVVSVERWMEDPEFAQEYVYNADEPRVSSWHVEATNMNYSETHGTVQFYFVVDYEMRVIQDGQEKLRPTSGTLILGCKLNESGEPLIHGMDANLQTEETPART